ncbi:hypothetical protein M0Q50_07215 [bacterium]|jgi:hypothetical protein|nr:hypothetical protein [bacterium]
METKPFKVLAVIIASWLIITTTMDLIWFCIFVLGILGMLNIFSLTYVEERFPMWHFFGIPVVTLFSISLLFIIMIAAENQNALMVLISLGGGFLFPFAIGIGFFDKNSHFLYKN